MRQLEKRRGLELHPCRQRHDLIHLGLGRRRAAVTHLMRKLTVSERMACRLARLSKSAYRRPLKAQTRTWG